MKGALVLHLGLFAAGATLGLGMGFLLLPHPDLRVLAVATRVAMAQQQTPAHRAPSPSAARTPVSSTKPIPAPIPAIDVSLLPVASSDAPAQGTLRRPQQKPRATSRPKDDEPATLDPAGIEALSKTLSKALDE